MRSMYIYIFSLLAAIGVQDTVLTAQDKQADLSMVPGTVIRHEPASSGVFVGAPSLVITPEGIYIASMNFTSIQGGDRGKVHRTAVYTSTDRGLHWTLQAEIDHMRWSSLFYYRETLYLMGVYEAFGNAVIRKSLDGGKTWTSPVDRRHGLLAEGRYHCAPVPVVIHEGRIWRAMEDALSGREFRVFMMSAAIDEDLLDADSWTFSNKIPFDRSWFDGTMTGWLEGNVVITPQQEVIDILRCGFSDGKHSIAAMVHISQDGKTARFDPESDFVRFPGASKKFTIRYDPESQKYWSLVNWIQPGDMKHLKKSGAGRIRNNLSLVSSKDLSNWIVERTVLYHPDIQYHAFQYVDWQFDGDDLVAVSRTAFDDGVGGADSYHNANFITFHRIKGFRNSIDN